MLQLFGTLASSPEGAVPGVDGLELPISFKHFNLLRFATQFRGGRLDHLLEAGPAILERNLYLLFPILRHFRDGRGKLGAQILRFLRCGLQAVYRFPLARAPRRSYVCFNLRKTPFDGGFQLFDENLPLCFRRELQMGSQFLFNLPLGLGHDMGHSLPKPVGILFPPPRSR